MFCEAIKRIDLYGKEPNFYYKHNSSKTTWTGRIFTFLYFGVYIAFFVYKIERMANRKDVIFYDTNSNRGETPSIYLNKELFYAAFAFDNPETNIPFIDEKIYTISGQYIVQTKENDEIKKDIKNFTFKQCEVSDFGSNYQNIMLKKNISRMLCPENIGFILEGYYTMEKFSYVKLNFQKCVNSSKNNYSCYPPDIINQKLRVMKIDTKLQDIEITPQDYDNPVRYLEREISGTSIQGFFPQIVVEMKIVTIETDNNIIGFESLTNLKIDKYLKYDTKTISAIPSDSLIIQDDDEKNNLNEITIQLSSNILYQKRTYTQLIDVLGDVGGLMEIINMIFSVICSIVVNMLYNKSMVNNLFNFDLNKKEVILKKRNIDKIKDLDTNNEITQKNNVEKVNNFRIKRATRKYNTIKNFYFSQSNQVGFDRFNKSSRRGFNFDNRRKNSYVNHSSTIIDDNTDNKNEVIYNNYRLNNFNNDSVNMNNIIKKIRTNIYFRFCYINHKGNINNILYDEGMKLIIEQLDIFNVFRRLFEISKFDLYLSEKDIKTQMSYECRLKLENIISKNLKI